MAANAPMGKNGRARSAERAGAAPTPCARPCAGLGGPFAPPPDLLAFLRSQPERAAAQALGLSHGMVHKLKAGYWPTDPRRVLAAWGRHQAAFGSGQGNDGVRRVQADGSVSVRGARYGGVGLVPGTLCLVYPQAGGTLQVQPLQALAPLVLRPLPEGGAA